MDSCQNCHRSIDIWFAQLHFLFCYEQLVKFLVGIKDKIGEDQSIVTTGKSCIDYKYTIQQPLERKKGINGDVYLVFIALV